MTKTTTRMDYGRRIARVAAYIAEHIDEELTLERLAEVACFSPHHFHRIYRGLTGETAAETIRRTRLQRAAFDLARSDRPIGSVAQRAGYGSVEAFTRAFASDHGLPPAAYRIALIHTWNGDDAMIEVKTTVFDGVRCAALAHKGPYHTIGERFEELTAWAGARNLFAKHRRWFAVYYDDPKSVPEKDLRSDACVEIGPEDPVDGDVRLIEIPPARVAVTVHKGPYAELDRVYDALYGEWLPDSGEEADDRPCFEQYLNNPRQTPPAELLTAVNLPLRG